MERPLPAARAGTSLTAFVGSCWCSIGALHLLEKKQGRGEQPLNRGTRRWTSIVNRPGRRRPRGKKNYPVQAWRSKSSPGLIIQWMPPIELKTAAERRKPLPDVGPRPGRLPGFIHAPSARPARSKAVMPPGLNYTEREPVGLDFDGFLTIVASVSLPALRVRSTCSIDAT
jgi:hypothetical protein